MKTPSHPWSFRQRLRTRAFGWRGSKLAIERLKEALGEIKTVARYDPETSAEGAVLLMERLWPALQAVDSSSGALGNATNRTVHELIDVLLAAPAEGARLERQLDRLWTAIEEGVDPTLMTPAAIWTFRSSAIDPEPTPSHQPQRQQSNGHRTFATALKITLLCCT
jgi:hypothetical protein